MEYDPDYAPRNRGGGGAGSNGLGLGMSIAGLVVGLASLILSFVPCVGALALWPGILAAALSFIGVLALKNGKGLGIAALLLSLGAVGMAVKQHLLIQEIADDFSKDLKKRRDSAADDDSGGNTKRASKPDEKTPPDRTTDNGVSDEKKPGPKSRKSEKRPAKPVVVTAQTDLTGLSVPELIEQLDQKQVQLRTRIIFELGKRGADAAEALPKLKELAEDPALEQAAKFAIKKIENP